MPMSSTVTGSARGMKPGGGGSRRQKSGARPIQRRSSWLLRGRRAEKEHLSSDMPPPRLRVRGRYRRESSRIPTGKDASREVCGPRAAREQIASASAFRGTRSGSWTTATRRRWRNR